uniref:UDP-N-acetylmuramoyl-L-alanyl-D-glutamate--2, 6-diaminopimelate ligase n=1 Tax=Nocardioides sp. BP30 TaxID=3036374 RepID=UPI0032AECC0C
MLTLAGDPDTEVTGISLSSQRILDGDLYAALPGSRVHGIEYVEDAVEAGAVAVLTDQEGIERVRPNAPVLAGVPVLLADDPRRLLGRLAARIYGEPATEMRMIGVTGTQGKTTTTRLITAGLEAAEVPAGVIGTVGTRVAGRDLRTALTTPEAPDLHALFGVMREAGVEACAMEVSSHALVMGRVDGVVYDVAVFLNLGRDHLDFHADLEDYYRAKASLFTPQRARLALICIDDEHGRRLTRETDLPVRTFSAQGAKADWRARNIHLQPEGSTFTAVGPTGRYDVRVPLPGDFNVSNALAAVAAVAEAGLDAEAFAAALGGSGGVPGRLERIDEGQDFTVVVDYAHKPDAVEAAIRTLRPLTAGRIITVLGAGGDRDPGKRPIMGEIAARLSDVLVVTDDNPRTEDPAAIRAAVLAGAAEGRAEVSEIGDRREAILSAIVSAAAGDIVLIAGKGHESGQIVGERTHPFDDRDVAREVIRARLEVEAAGAAPESSLTTDA